MRPLQFPKMAGNSGLAIGNSIAQGLNSGLKNYAQMRMQAAHMKAIQTQAEGMKAWHQAQAESLRQKSLGSSIQDVQLLQEMAKGAHADKSVINKLIQPRIETFLNNAKPEEKSALMAHIKQQQDQGQIPSEIAGDMNFNANQMKYLGQGQNQQAKQSVADTSAAARMGAAHVYGDTRVKVSQNEKAGRLGAAEISANSRTGGLSKEDQIAFHGSESRIRDLTNRYADADKPNAMGMVPSPEEVKNKRAMLKDMLNDEHTHQTKLLSPSDESSQGQGAPAPLTPSRQAPGSQIPVLQHTQVGQAKPGDIVQHQDGRFFKMLGNNQAQQVENPNAQAVPLPSAPGPQPGMAPPAAPVPGVQ